MEVISKIQVGGANYGIVPPAGLTQAQQEQARANIGAISESDVDVVQNGTYPDMTVGEATHAQTADSATNAVNAQRATADGTGRNISQTYFTKQQIIDLLFPVGAHYIQYSGESTPAALFGGTWEIDTDYTGRVLVGGGTGYTLGEIGGETTHAQTVEELAAHIHDQIEGAGQVLYAGEINASTAFVSTVKSNSGTLSNYKLSTSSKGEGQPFNIMQPYKVVNVWKRTA